MSRSAEQIALDEKIARIRKQNEEIIRRKQIIDEEIKNAERHNAIVNIKKTYSDDDDGDDNNKPSLYADSFSTRQLNTTVTYPKMRVAQVCRNDRERSKHEDVAWRREREQIDNERIRRQKAASGWKREWDANKTLENGRESLVESNQRIPTFRSQQRRSNEYGDNSDRMVSSSSLQGNRPPADADDPWKANRDTSYRSQPRSQQTHERKPMNPNYSVSNRVSPKSEHRNDLELTRSWSGKEEPGKPLNDTRSTTIVAGNKPTTCWQTSILRRATSVEDKPNIIITNVTKCSDTKTLPWKKEFSAMEEDSAESLSKSLKNIVIHVKNDNVKEAGRIVELVDKSTTHAESSKNSTIQPPTTTKSAPTAGILKKSPEVSRSDEFQQKKSVIILENVEKNKKNKSVPTTEVADGDSDSEWEDVDEDEWEDVSN